MKFIKDSTVKYGEAVIIGDLLRLEEDVDGRVSIRATGAGGTGILLDDLTDVTISSPAVDQFLRYNGSLWINQLITAGSIGSGTFKVGGFAFGGPVNINSVSAVNSFSITRGHITNVLLPSKTAAIQITGDDSSGGAQLNNPPNIALISPEVGVAGDQNQSDAKLELIASRSTIAQLNAGTFTAVVNGDMLGEIRFGGDDSVNIRSHGARIRAAAGGTWTAASHPGLLYLATVASGTTSNAIDRWIVDHLGHFYAANDNVYDIGNSTSLRPRTIYPGTSISIPNSSTGSLWGRNAANNANLNLFGLDSGDNLNIGRDDAIGTTQFFGQNTWFDDAASPAIWMDLSASNLIVSGVGTVRFGTDAGLGGYFRVGGSTSLSLDFTASGRIDHRFYDTAAAVDAKRWEISIDGAAGANSFAILMRADAGTLGPQVFRAFRSGNTLTSIDIGLLVNLTPTVFSPSVSAGVTLGSSSLPWGTIYGNREIYSNLASGTHAPSPASSMMFGTGSSQTNFRGGFAHNAYWNGATWNLPTDGANSGGQIILGGIANDGWEFHTIVSSGVSSQSIPNTQMALYRRLRVGNTAVTMSNITRLDFAVDNTIDIGQSAATRPRTAYIGTSLVVGTDPTGAAVARFGGDIRIGPNLGIFDSTSTPTTDNLLSYNGTKWVARYLQPALTTGQVVATNLVDNTAATYVNDGRAVAGTPTAPTNIQDPIATALYRAVFVDMSAYGALPSDKVFVLDYSVNGGGYTTNAIISTSSKVVHSNLIPANTYTYKYKIRGATDSAYSDPSNTINPSDNSEVNAFGVIVASQIAVANLSAINVSIGDIAAGQARNPGNTAGILFSGTLPGTWTRYVNFTATGANPVFKHELLSLNADGTATFNGFVDITAVGLQTYGSFAKHAIRVHDAGIGHGMTDILPTDAFGLIGGDPTTADGGFIITGIAVSTTIEALGLYGLQVTGSTTKAAVALVGAKKSGTTFGDLASTEKIFGVWNNNTELIKVFGNGATTFNGLLTVVGEKNAQVKWSTSDPSGTPPDGTIWVKY